MTVEVKTEAKQVAEVVVSEEEQPVKVIKVVENAVEEDAEAKKEDDSKPRGPRLVEKSSSYKEESNFLSDLTEQERKALNELKLKLEEAILNNNLFKKEEPKENSKSSKQGEDRPEEREKELAAKEEEEDLKNEGDTEEQKEKPDVAAEEQCPQDPKIQEDGEKKPEMGAEADKDISLWGVPLLPSKGAEGIDVVLLKFLRAREFKVNEAFEMLKKALQWRKELKMDSILDEDFDTDLASAAYMSGIDREGHPVCYNIFGVLDNEEIYQKTFGTEEKCEKFMRWRFQCMEKGIQKLDFKPAGINSLLQINDLKNSPGPSKKEVRVAIKQAVGLLQDNYPEFVARNIFINVPFWYYAFHALLSPFLTHRTKSKFVVARPAKVTETLLKYIPIEQIPTQYGGLKRGDDFEFLMEGGGVSDLHIKAGSSEIIEIPTPEVENTFIWDLTVLGWEVNYKEEFVPRDEGSYSIIIQKGKKMNSNEGPVRNTFKNNEPGKIVLTIENVSSKKKNVFYRYKMKKSC